MRFASLLTLIALANPVMADTTDRAAFLPLPDKIAAPVESAVRAALPAEPVGQSDLDRAEIARVDRDRDGRISFEELLLHNTAFDF